MFKVGRDIIYFYLILFKVITEKYTFSHQVIGAGTFLTTSSRGLPELNQNDTLNKEHYVLNEYIYIYTGIYIVHFDNSPPPLLRFIFFPDK